MKPEPTVEELEEEFRDLYDKWCWETGLDEDKKRLDELAAKIKSQKAHDKIMDEVMEYAAEEIRKEIDNELLEKIRKLANEEP